jgi:hypothetical protein
MSLIAGMRGVKSKHCLQLLQAALLVEDPMASGLDRDHPHRHGKMGTSVTGRKTAARLVPNGALEVVMTGEHHPLIIGLPHRRRRESSGGRIGAMVLMLDMVTSPHLLATVVILCQLYHVMVLMQAIDGAHLRLAMYTFQHTKEVQDGHVNQMNSNDTGRATLATQEMAHQTTGPIEIVATATEIGQTDQVIREALVGNGEMAGRGREVQIGGTGTAIPGTMTSIGGDDAYQGQRGSRKDEVYSLDSNSSTRRTWITAGICLRRLIGIVRMLNSLDSAFDTTTAFHWRLGIKAALIASLLVSAKS